MQTITRCSTADLGHAVDQWIMAHEQEMLRDIAALVSIKSVAEKGGAYPYGFGCAKVLDSFLELGNAYGFNVLHHEYHCGSLTFGGQGKRIGVWGHLDVVPEGIGWRFPPYACQKVGDFLLGRGVQDNKGPVVAVLYALRCIKELDVPIRNAIIQIVGCGEEIGMEDAQYYLRHNPAPDFSFIADSGFPVCYGEKGICEVLLTAGLLGDNILSLTGGTVANSVPDTACALLKKQSGLAKELSSLPQGLTVKDGEDGWLVTAQGLSKHVAFPEGSVNAVGLLCSALTACDVLTDKDQKQIAFIAKLCSSFTGEYLDIVCEDAISGPLTCVCSLASIQQGRISLTLNIRYPVQADFNTLLCMLRQACEHNGFAVTVLSNSKPNYYPKDSDCVQALMRAYRQVTDSFEEPFVMGGGTYARKIPNAVAFGPGMPADTACLDLPEGHGACHTPDEAQSVSNLLKALKIYVLALLELDAIL